MATEATTSGAQTGPWGAYGPYRPTGVLGEGGMGIVYLAEQVEPVRRRVALKVMKQAAAGSLMARFEAERQVLALLDHPHIAKLHDAGQTSDGRPWFAMEYVAGVPITDYCDTNLLGCNERLQLFQQVCLAVEHAHEKGIVHRDLKPSNILVTKTAGVAMPKVIDFGVAKAVNARLTERTLFTEMGMLIGTPEYMSPEQAAGAVEVDSATDIYALGVLLYELLVGAPPFDSKMLRRAGYDAICRIIRETDPPRPSVRLESLGETAGEVARRRGGSVAALMRTLHGDLEWITMKALEKEQVRRYASASDFAADLERHLQDQPVMARAPAASYRLRKFVRRRRLEVIAAAAVVVAIACSLFALRRSTAPSGPTTISQHKIQFSVDGIFGSYHTDGRRVIYWKAATRELVYSDVSRQSARVIYHGNAGGPAEFVPSRDFSAVAMVFGSTSSRPAFVAVVRTDGAGYREFLRTDDQGAEFGGLNWSWDARSLLVYRRTGAVRHLLWLSATTGESRELAVWSGITLPRAVFSPDGRFIAHQDLKIGSGQTTARLLVVPSQGGEARVVYEEPLGNSSFTFRLFDWTANGRYLVISSTRTMRAALYLVPVSDGQPDGTPVFVRYGRFEYGYITRAGALIYQLPKSGGLWPMSIVALDANGRPGAWRSLDGASQNDIAPAPHWSPDGNQIVYIARDPDVGVTGNAVVRARNLSTGEDREVYRTAGNIRCIWAARPSRILCGQILKGTEILGIDPGSGQIEHLGSLTEPAVLDRASSDGRALYLTRIRFDGQQSFCRWNISTRRESILAQYRGERQVPFLVSPDERWLVAHDEHDIRVRPIAGGEWKSLISVDTRRVAVTPDGKWVYYSGPIATGRMALFRASMAGGPPERLGDSPGTTLGNLDISPDARQIVGSSLDLINGLEVWSLENFVPSDERK